MNIACEHFDGKFRFYSMSSPEQKYEFNFDESVFPKIGDLSIFNERWHFAYIFPNSPVPNFLVRSNIVTGRERSELSEESCPKLMSRTQGIACTFSWFRSHGISLAIDVLIL